MSTRSSKREVCPIRCLGEWVCAAHTSWRRGAVNLCPVCLCLVTHDLGFPNSFESLPNSFLIITTQDSLPKNPMSSTLKRDDPEEPSNTFSGSVWESIEAHLLHIETAFSDRESLLSYHLQTSLRKNALQWWKMNEESLRRKDWQDLKARMLEHFSTSNSVSIDGIDPPSQIHVFDAWIDCRWHIQDERVEDFIDRMDRLGREAGCSPVMTVRKIISCLPPHFTRFNLQEYGQIKKLEELKAAVAVSAALTAPSDEMKDVYQIESISACEDTFHPLISWPSSGGTLSDFLQAVEDLNAPSTDQLGTIGLREGMDLNSSYCCAVQGGITGLIHLTEKSDTDEAEAIWSAIVEIDKRPRLSTFYQLDIHGYWLSIL